MPHHSKSRTGKSHTGPDNHKRLRIATEAARIMAEEGVKDFQTAKRKAAERLSLSQIRDLPGNEEVQFALSTHLKLFHGPELARNTRRLRQTALEAMTFLAPFEPRLVGSVLAGTVTPTSEIQLHVCADSPEQVGLFLQEQGIPVQLGEQRVRFGGERYKKISTYRFTAADTAIELYVFDRRSVREVPLSPIDGRPMQRAHLQEVQALLQG
jgi:hypothetical protein